MSAMTVWLPAAAIAVPAQAAEMIPQPIALLQGLDKTTARVSRFDAPVGAEVHFGTLSIIVRSCRRSAPEDTPDNAAFLQISEKRPGENQVQLFSGWMFSSRPALAALENPVYDVNLLECKGAAPPAATANPPTPAAPAPPAAPRGKTPR